MALVHGRWFSLGLLASILCLFTLGCAANPSQVKNPSQRIKEDTGPTPPAETLRIDVVSRPTPDMPEVPLTYIVLRSGANNAIGRGGKPAVAAAEGVPVEIAMVARVNGRPVTPGKGGPGGESARTAASDAIGRVTVDIASFLRELPGSPAEIGIRATIQGPPPASQTVTLDAATCARLYRPLEEERAGDRALAEGKGLVALDRYARAFDLNVDPNRKVELWGKIVKVTRALPIKPALPEEVRRMLVQSDALAKRDEVAKALPLLEKAKRKAPWFPPVHYNLAMTNAMNKDFSGAIASMTAYLEIAPDAPDARLAKDKIYEWETMLPASGTGREIIRPAGSREGAREGSQVKRLCAALLGVVLLSSPPPAAWGGCVAVYSQSYVQTLERASRMHYEPRNALPSNITTISQCESWLRSQSIWRSDAGYRQTTCECGGSSSGGSGYTPSLGPGATVQQQVAAGIIGAMFASVFAPPPAGPSPEEVARKKAEAEEARRKAEEEARRKAAEEARRQALEKERRLALARQMQGPEGGSISTGGRGIAGWKGLDADPSPPQATSGLAMLSPRPTAGMTSEERLRCAAALMEASRQYSGLEGPEAAEKTRFYAQQGELVATGQLIDVDCPASMAGLSIPEPSPPMRVDDPPPTPAELREFLAADRAALDNVSARLQGLAERRQKIEEKKVEAAKRIAAPPVDNAAGVDPLVAQAEALLRESEAELAAVERDEKDLLEERNRLAATLAGHEEQARLLSGKEGK